MMRRRDVLSGILGAGMAAALPVDAADVAVRQVRLPRKYHPQEVSVNPGLPAGRIIVDSDARFMYLTYGDGRARRYGIAIGADGRQFRGTAVVARKAEWPSWIPTPGMIAAEPDLYGPYRAGLPGGHPRNPLGSRALYLHRDGRDTLYRIHGTPQPWTIGRSFSSGCIRTANEWMNDLYDRVPVGTVVHAP